MSIEQTIQRVKELAKEIIPVPWETNYTGNIWGDIDNPEHDGDSPLIAKTNEQTAEADFIVAAANSIMPIISDRERLKAELLDCANTGLDKSIEIRDLQVELSKAQEKIKELEVYRDELIKAKPHLLKLEKIIKAM